MACQTESENACQIAERIMASVQATKFSIGEAGERIAVTCSVGIACYPFGEPVNALDWEQVLKLADVAVYQAKKAGRNRWVQLAPGQHFQIDDAESFVQAVKTNTEALVEAEILQRTSGK